MLQHTYKTFVSMEQGNTGPTAFKTECELSESNLWFFGPTLQKSKSLWFFLKHLRSIQAAYTQYFARIVVS